MRIRTRLVGLIAALFAVLGGVQYAVQTRVLLPSFAELERDAARRDMERVSRVLQRELDLLLVTARDYGNWADTYRFMHDGNADYAATNLTPASLATLRVQAFALVAPDGRYAWSSGRVELTRGAPIDVLTARGLPDAHPWREAVRAGTPVAGLMRTNRGPMLAAIAPVLDGVGNGPPRGAVLVGRLLDDAELARFAEQAQVQLLRVPIAAPGLPAVDAPARLVERDDVTEVLRAFPDIAGRAVLGIRIDVPRTITARGAHAVAYASAFLAGAGLTVLLLILFVVDRTILAPLERMKGHAVRIGRDQDLAARLRLGRRDELGALANEFDRMVEQLADARRQMVDLSFRAGVAENASGVLHNVGNAMTPLAVTMEGLRRRVAETPAADLELVLAELAADGSGDTARRADLEEFLRLGAAELVRVVGDTARELEAASRQAELIQRALAAQSEHSRAGTVLEWTSMPELLEQALAAVPPALRDRLAIEVAPSVAAVGRVRLARIPVVQVFQNLLVNAAEAIRDAGTSRGVLRVWAEEGPDSDGGRLVLCFADEGVGIREQDLGRVFERGFTTKPGTNCGIGLHWCANALQALGGSIAARSEGIGRGATLRVTLPLESTPARERIAA